MDALPRLPFHQAQTVGLGPWPAQDAVFQVLTPRSQGPPLCHSSPAAFTLPTPVMWHCPQAGDKQSLY